MASVLMSFSESVQASVLLRQPTQKQEGPEEAKGVGLCVQLLLVAALFGIEMVIAFEQIYQVLFHQFLGVPVSLVSVNGIVCGAISMSVLPVLGYCSDRGSNPMRRKLFSLFVGMCTFLSGLLMLASGGALKLLSGKSSSDNSSSPVALVPADNTSLPDGQFSNTSLEDWTTSWTLVTPASNANTSDASDSQIPITAFLSILGFAAIDVGFDVSISITRAFILETTPAFQHTRLLVLATVAASMGGTTFSFLGCFDFPNALGPLFQAEGVAVTLIFFCGLLFCIVVTGYGCTILIGNVLHRKAKSPPAALLPTVPEDDVISWTGRRQSSTSRDVNRAERARRDRTSDILHTEEASTSTRPLLLEDSIKTIKYSSMSISTSVFYPPNAPGDPRPEHHLDKPQGSLLDSDTLTAKNLHENASYEASTQDLKGQPGEPESEATLRVMNDSMSMSVGRPSISYFHSKKLAYLTSKQSSNAAAGSSKIYMNKRLNLLCASCFFTFGTLVAFIVYISNALNIGILQGDPTAQPGTPEYDRYQDGLRTAALGNLVLYVTYMVISVNNTKLISLIGERAQFVACHVVLILTLTTLLLTQRVEVYFVFMVTCGAYRTCVFTIPFVLANKFTQNENEAEKNGPGKTSPKNLGKVMSLIGFLIPAHYILLSSFMGPLMDLTGSVWVPLIYSLCSCTIALVIFLFLFLVKN